MLAAVSTVCASAVWMAVEMAATWWVRKVLGDARPSPYLLREVGGAGKPRQLGKDAERGHEGSAERTGGLG